MPSAPLDLLLPASFSPSVAVLAASPLLRAINLRSSFEVGTIPLFVVTKCTPQGSPRCLTNIFHFFPLTATRRFLTLAFSPIDVLNEEAQTHLPFSFPFHAASAPTVFCAVYHGISARIFVARRISSSLGPPGPPPSYPEYVLFIDRLISLFSLS